MISGSQITQMMRPWLVKVITRIVIYGLAAICARAGIASEEASSQVPAIAEGLAAVLLVIVGGVIDKWHHHQDINENAFLK